MNIVHISYQLRGGAGHSLIRHHRELLKRNINSQIITGDGKAKNFKSPFIHNLADLIPPFSKGEARLEKLSTRLRPIFGEAACFLSQSSLKLPDTKIIREADIVELRMLHSGHGKIFFNLKVLPVLSRLKPIVWRLSDMWAFTGFCAYSFDCRKWHTGCRKCPQMNPANEVKAELPVPRFDVSRYSWRTKRKCYQKSKLHIVCPSHWIYRQVEESILADRGSLTEIPVGADTEIFYPRENGGVRKRLGVDPASFVILASIPSPTNYRKACDLLFEILGKLNGKGIELILIGTNKAQFPESLKNIKCHQVGYISSEEELAGYYASSDLFLFPSRCDNSAQVILEAAACGLPTIGFDVCGNPEYIKSGQTGYLIEPYDTAAMARTIENLRADRPGHEQLKKNAVKYVQATSTVKSQADAFVKVYHEILDRQ